MEVFGKVVVRLNRKNFVLVGLKKQLLPDQKGKCYTLSGMQKSCRPTRPKKLTISRVDGEVFARLDLKKRDLVGQWNLM